MNPHRERNAVLLAVACLVTAVLLFAVLVSLLGKAMYP